ncbi:MAG: hypothetical protein HZC38_13745 [Chloroflexi bacterium]|nr:hypothetical protein [Chloroflexota bacterium]
MTNRIFSLAFTSFFGAIILLAVSALLPIATMLLFAGGSGERGGDSLGIFILWLFFVFIVMIITTVTLHTLIGASVTIVHRYLTGNTLSLNRNDLIVIGAIASCCAQILATLFGAILIVLMLRSNHSLTMFAMFIGPSVIDLIKIVLSAPLFGAFGGSLVVKLQERKAR